MASGGTSEMYRECVAQLENAKANLAAAVDDPEVGHATTTRLRKLVEFWQDKATKASQDTSGLRRSSKYSVED